MSDRHHRKSRRPDFPFAVDLISVAASEAGLGEVARLLEIVLSQPMLAGTRLQTNVVAPTKPGIALENGFGLMECCKSIFALAGMIKINTQVDKRVGFGLEDMMRAADFKTAVIVFARLVEVWA